MTLLLGVEDTYEIVINSLSKKITPFEQSGNDFGELRLKRLVPCPLPGSSLKMSTGHFLNAPPPFVENEGDWWYDHEWHLEVQGVVLLPGWSSA